MTAKDPQSALTWTLIDVEHGDLPTLVLSKSDLVIVEINQRALSLYGLQNKPQVLHSSYLQLFPAFNSMSSDLGMHFDADAHGFYARCQCTGLCVEEQEYFLLQIIALGKPDHFGDSLLTLISGMAHEMNTPLGILITAMSLMSGELERVNDTFRQGLLKRKELADSFTTLKDASHSVQESTNRLSNLVEQFKRVSVAWNFETLVSFDARHYLEQIIHTKHKAMRKRGIKCFVNCPDDLKLFGDASAFIQIVEELLDNAILSAFDRIEDPTINLMIKRDQDKVTIRLRDNGVGIEPGLLSRIFDPFYTTNRHQGHLGLGLTMIFYIVTYRLEGEIKVSQDCSQGSEFTVTFAQMTKGKESDDNLTLF